MYKVYNIEDFKNNSSLFVYLIDEIYKFSKLLNIKNYLYKEWFYNIQVEKIGNGRTILFVINEYNNIVGICHLKKNDNEKKICYLYVDLNYRNKGIENILLEESFNYLNTIKPKFTFCLDEYNVYKGVIDEFGWKISQIGNNCELSYNGRKKIK